MLRACTAQRDEPLVAEPCGLDGEACNGWCRAKRDEIRSNNHEKETR
jgi:hypothetical protein